MELERHDGEGEPLTGAVPWQKVVLVDFWALVVRPRVAPNPEQ